ncbi:MAG: GNAT family N-acetyltransferase [Desulfobulbus sp.]
MKISTDRLELVAATLDHVRAELESPERLATQLNAEVGFDWPPGEYDRNAQEFFRDCLQKGGSAVVGWYGWYAIRDDQYSELIGAGGYLGLPCENGEVEIGFSIVNKWQSAGYATEMARALVINALADSRVQKIIAHTTPQNLASCKVLEKVGFKVVDTDEKLGRIRFEIHRNDPPQTKLIQPTQK